MARRGRATPEESEDDAAGSDDEEELFEPAPRPRRRATPRRPAPVREWRSDSTVPDEPWDEPVSRWSLHRSDRGPVYWRARDSLYFEPLIALSIVLLLLVGIYTYTQNWPPIYVVESGSMMHGPNDQVGAINPGDMVLAEKVATSEVVPYVVGARTGVHTYGEPGDVLIYHPNGTARGTPIVHRAIVYLQWDPSSKKYNATDLEGLSCHNGPRPTDQVHYYYPGCPASLTELDGELTIYGLAGAIPSINLSLSCGAGSVNSYGDHSGFVTLGDHNPQPDQNPRGNTGCDTPPSLSTLVESKWIVGVARGMIPWFGALKLLLDGNARNVTSGSWQFLGLSLVGFILAAFAVHWALRQEGIESPIRRREEEEATAARAEAHASGRRRGPGSLRPWPDEEEAEPEDEEAPPRRPRRPGGTTPAAPRPVREPVAGRDPPRAHRTPRRRRTTREEL